MIASAQHGADEAEPVVYEARVTLKPSPVEVPGEFPAVPEKFTFGFHGALAEHYDVAEEIDRPRASSLDYLVASLAGCLAGTFVDALQARGLGPDVDCQATGQVIDEGGTLVLRRVLVAYSLSAPRDQRDLIERVHRVHPSVCPVHRSLHKSIEIETSLAFSD